MAKQEETAGDSTRVPAMVAEGAAAGAPHKEIDTPKRKRYKAQLLRQRGKKMQLRFREKLHLKLSKPGMLQLSWNGTDIIQVKLSETDILQLSETDILQLRSNGARVLHLRLTETDILQLQGIEAGTVPSRLSETDILQLQSVEAGHVQQQLNKTGILLLEEHDILRVELRETKPPN